MEPSISLSLHLPMMGLDASEMSIMTQWDHSVLPSLHPTRRRKRGTAQRSGSLSGSRNALLLQGGDGEEDPLQDDGDRGAQSSTAAATAAENALSLERMEKMAKVRARLDRRSAAAVQAAYNRRALQDAIRDSVADVKVPTAESVGRHTKDGLLMQSGSDIRRKEATRLVRERQEQQFSAYL